MKAKCLINVGLSTLRSISDGKRDYTELHHALKEGAIVDLDEDACDALLRLGLISCEFQAVPEEPEVGSVEKATEDLKRKAAAAKSSK